MLVVGMVSRSEESEKKDKDGKPYLNLAIEGFSVIPDSGLGSVPPQGEMIEGVVAVRWPKGGGRPLHFLTRWNRVGLNGGGNGA